MATIPRPAPRPIPRLTSPRLTSRPTARLSAGSTLLRVLAAVAAWLTILGLLTFISPRSLAAGIDGSGTGTGHSQPRAATWLWPLTPQPAGDRRFERPATRFGAGHRGIDVSAAPGADVTAVAAGVVTHSGVIAGRGTVTVRHASGVASTYEPLDDRVATGTAVEAGTVLGTIGAGSHCDPAPCLHLGARLGEEYLAPLLLFTRARIILPPLLPDGEDHPEQCCPRNEGIP